MSASGEMWMRWRVRVGYPVGLLYAVLADPLPAWIAYGGVMALLGLLIRGAAAGHLRKHEALATSGPYAFTRNPLYLGSALIAVGFLVAGRSWVAGVLVLVYFALFYVPVMRREEQELRQRYGAAFDDYAARVPLFWPRRAPSGDARTPFSWESYRRNREYQAALGVLFALVLLWAKWMWWR